MATSQPPSPIELMHRRMLQLREDLSLGDPEQGAALDEAFEAFGVALEELRVAEENLSHANEFILTTRQKLEADRRRYHELFDLAPDGYVVTDPSGIIRDANRAAAAVFNVPQHFVPGKALANFVAEADRRAFQTTLVSIAGGAAPPPWAVRVCPRHSDPIEVEVSVSHGSENYGQGRELLWLLRQVGGRGPAATAPRPVDELVVAERDRLRRLIDCVGAVLWEADPVTGQLTAVSREAEGLLGEPADAWLDAPDGWASRIHPDDRPMVASLREKQIAARGDLEMEYRFLVADGRSVWVREISRFCVDQRGEPEAIRGVLVNISRRKRVERRLYFTRGEAESQARELNYLLGLCQRLSVALDLPDVLEEIVTSLTAIQGTVMGSISLPDPERPRLVVAASVGLSEDVIREKNDHLGSSTPCARAFTEGRSVVVEDVEEVEECAGHRDLFRRAGIRAIFSTPLFSFAGESVGVLSSYFAEPFRPSDRQRWLVELYARQAGQFIVNARRLATLREADRRKDEFLSALGHELRGPLAGIGSALRLLDFPPSEGATRQVAHKVLIRLFQHIARLVDEIIDASQTERGRFEPSKMLSGPD